MPVCHKTRNNARQPDLDQGPATRACEMTQESLDMLSGDDSSRHAEVRDYIALLKPRVMSLVVFTSLIGLTIAPGSGDMHPFLGFIAILCIAVGAGASGAINMWYDSDIDAVMARTRARPIPMGLVAREEALTFGIILSLFSVLLMFIAINWVAAALLAFTIFFYAVVYTMWLKRRTPQNIVIGGLSGALPPAIGWAAVTGDITIESLLLVAIIFIWTPSHFWALSLWRRGDYDRAGVPMLPVVAGEKATRNQILFYALLLVPFAVAPIFIGMTGWPYAVVAIGLNIAYAVLAVQVWRDDAGLDDNKAAKRLFAFSILYLFLTFLTMGIDDLLMRFHLI